MKLKSRTDSRPEDIKKELTELKQGLDTLGISFNTQHIKKFRRYIEILLEYKNRIHLLSHQDYNRITRRHFLPSLMAFPYIKNHCTACDIGTGAGFPALPLKIFMPEIDFTLFESRGKKAKFLRYLIDELELTGTNVIDDRAEKFKGNKFNLILLKAVGRIKKLIKTIDNLMLPHGCAIFYKSHRVAGEIKSAEKELKKRGFQLRIEKLHTPIENLPLALVILKK
jgi:16S rRNA (guanine527-N7)-methyltransferase